MKNVRKDIVKGIEKGEGWEPVKLTGELKKALKKGRSHPWKQPFDFQPGHIPEELKNEKISVTLPKSTRIKKMLKEEKELRRYVACKACGNKVRGASRLTTALVRAVREDCARVPARVAMEKGIIASDQNALVEEIATAIRGKAAKKEEG